MVSFWSGGDIEPKRSNRWIAQLDFFADDPSGNSSFTFLITSFTKPTFEIGSETIINNFTSETEIVAKAYQWPDISVTMIDVENSELNASSKVYDWLVASGYEPEQTIGRLSNLYANLDSGKFSVYFNHINSDGNPIEEWSFTKPQPTSFTFGGEVSYDSDNIMTVTMGITFVSAQYRRLDTPQKSRTPGFTPGGFTPGVPPGQSFIPGVTSPGGII